MPGGLASAVLGTDTLASWQKEDNNLKEHVTSMAFKEKVRLPLHLRSCGMPRPWSDLIPLPMHYTDYKLALFSA